LAQALLPNIACRHCTKGNKLEATEHGMTEARLTPIIGAILRIAAALALAPVWGAAFAQAQYPLRPVQIVVPFVAGGNTDLITRIIADGLSLALKQPFTVVTKPGAAANIGAAYVASSEPDGYTLLMGPPGPLAINQYLYASLAFDPDKSFSPVVLVARFPNVLVVPPSLGVRSIRELIDRAGANPGRLDYASSGVGSSGHLSSVLFMAMARIDINHVPYKGTGEFLRDVIAGRIAMTIDNLGPILPFIENKQLLPLGVSTRDPVALLPGIPPIAEAVPGYEASSWNALMAPAGTREDIVARLNAATNRVLAKPDIADKLRAFGSEPAGGSVAELAQFLADERVRWKRAVDIVQGK
jgi:tripartite-type tricarboxylate transporter receptor subunit TctC